MTVPRCMTLEQYRQLEEAGKITRPLSDQPIGAYTTARRENDAAASAAHTHHDPYGTADRQKPGCGTYPGCGTPHGITAHERRYERPCDACKQAKNAVNRAQWAARRAHNATTAASVDAPDELAVGTHPHDPNTANRHTDPSRGTSVPHRTENPK